MMQIKFEIYSKGNIPDKLFPKMFYPYAYARVNEQ